MASIETTDFRLPLAYIGDVAYVQNPVSFRGFMVNRFDVNSYWGILTSSQELGNDGERQINYKVGHG